MVRIANDTAGGGDRETVFVQSLQRGLAVIRAFDADNAALTLGDVAKSTSLARAAARRFVLTLVELGYVRVDGRLFRLSPRVLELGRPYLSSLTLPEIARPRQQAFVDAVRESSSLAILDDTDIVYVSHVAADRIMAVVVAVGTRDPAVTTSLGRVLLAGQSQEWLRTFLAAHRLAHRTERTIVDPERLLDELLRIREQGYALVDQELEEGLRALAVPLHDASGQVVAAVNVAVHASRWSLDAIRGELLPRLQEMAAEIDQDAVEAAARVTPAIPAQRREPAPEPRGRGDQRRRRRRARDGVRAVAAAGPGGDPGVRRRAPGAHPERRRPGNRPRPGRGPPLPAHPGRAGLRAGRRPALPAHARGCSSWAGRTCRA